MVQEAGRPPVAWAAASRAEMEDMESVEGGGMSRPMALAASIREEEEELEMAGFRSTFINFASFLMLTPLLSG